MKKETWKKIKTAISYPKSWVVMLLYVTTLTAWGLGIVTIATGHGLTVFAFVMYGLCALLIAYSVYVTVRLAGAIREKVLDVADKYAFTRKLSNDFSFRTVFFGMISFLFSVGYTVALLITAIRAKSAWYWFLVGYYLLIATVRGIVVIRHAQTEKRYKDDFINMQLSKIRIYRHCGWIFLALSAILLFSVAQMVIAGTRFPAPDSMIYAFGAYAIYLVIISLSGLIKARKYEDLSASAQQNVNFITSLVILLTFQTVLLDKIATVGISAILGAVSGVAVCVTTLLFGIYMIKRSEKAEKNMQSRIKKEE